MDSYLSGERRITERTCIVDSTAHRFDKSDSNAPRLARVHDDVRCDESVTVASPYSSVSCDTHIANIVIYG
jgi:hypothetical protein